MKDCINSLCKYNDIQDNENFEKCPYKKNECHNYTNSKIQAKQRIKYRVEQLKSYLLIAVMFFLMGSGIYFWIERLLG